MKYLIISGLHAGEELEFPNDHGQNVSIMEGLDEHEYKVISRTINGGLAFCIEGESNGDDEMISRHLKNMIEKYREHVPAAYFRPTK